MKRLMSVVVCLFLLPQIAPAQSQSNSWDNLKQLKPGQKIEVVDMNSKSLKGEFVALSAEEISFMMGKRGVSILRTNVKAVKNLEKNRRVRRGVVGALLGAAGGAATGVLVSSTFADSSETAYGAYVGFLIGAGAGAGLGAGLPSPVTIYEVP